METNRKAKKKFLRREYTVPAILLIYLAVMSYIGYPEYASGKSSALYYFGIIGTTLFIIILLHFFLKKRDQLRREREADLSSHKDDR